MAAAARTALFLPRRVFLENTIMLLTNILGLLINGLLPFLVQFILTFLLGDTTATTSM